MQEAGKQFRELLHKAKHDRSPLKLVGVTNAFVALMAKKIGFHALYLSGAGVANNQFALPDLGLTNLTDVAEEARRITHATGLPLLVDCDTGWGNALSITRTVQTLTQLGVAGIHLEDQIDSKRCGHRDGKRLCSQQEMVGRLQSAIAAREEASFLVMARTDAIAVEGVEKTRDRIKAYEQAGADALFIEAVTSQEQIALFCESTALPVLINLTEFGKTPPLSVKTLGECGVAMALFPLTLSRIMNHAAWQALQVLHEQDSASTLLDKMQTRDTLYELLNYEQAEKALSHSPGKED